MVASLSRNKIPLIHQVITAVGIVPVTVVTSRPNSTVASIVTEVPGVDIELRSRTGDSLGCLEGTGGRQEAESKRAELHGQYF